ncbi:AraC-type DNA-binding protein [Pelosinus propionicus DSM 13327]|uniref:AraC-type DNA-binding protein n=2 Tax=Pelosinus TaxID=365348 RepID=A0A1I4ITR5_9FIRM|nr:AraC-type DNA-binding protein [Pelosinus propionicus DSM 13327]
MFDVQLKPYEMINVINEDCPICEGFGQIYNLETSEYEFVIPAEMGQGYCKQIAVNSQFQVLYFDMNFSQTIEVQGISRIPHIDLFFCFEEGFQWTFHGKKTQLGMLAGESFLVKSRESRKKCMYPSAEKIRFMQIKMNLHKFEELIQNVCSDWDISGIGKCEEIFQRSSISPVIYVILQQILNCSYKGALKNMFIEGKILELFAVYFNESLLEQERKEHKIKLSTNDINSIYQARKVLDDQIVVSPSLACLAKQVCLNEFKLKNGFKRIFGETVHAYVIAKRLELARQLFEEGQMSVSEVAGASGYANVSHFAQAFRKKFGVNPKIYLRHVVKE